MSRTVMNQTTSRTASRSTRGNSDVGVVIAVLLAATGAGIFHWMTKTAPVHIAVGVDRSLSVEPNCAGFAQAVGSTFSLPGIQSGSTLSYLAIGPNPRDAQPDLLWTEPIPIADDSVFGRDENARTYEQETSELFDRVTTSCKAGEPTLHTPLLAMVERGLELLSGGSFDCGPDDGCVLMIKTDLLEDVDPTLTALLSTAAKEPGVAVPSELVGRLKNPGTKVVYCGLSETRPQSNKTPAPPSIESRKRIWRAMHSEPDLVSFLPYCIAGIP